jgi:hypothetical protein
MHMVRTQRTTDAVAEDDAEVENDAEAEVN